MLAAKLLEINKIESLRLFLENENNRLKKEIQAREKKYKFILSYLEEVLPWYLTELERLNSFVEVFDEWIINPEMKDMCTLLMEYETKQDQLLIEFFFSIGLEEVYSEKSLNLNSSNKRDDNSLNFN